MLGEFALILQINGHIVIFLLSLNYEQLKKISHKYSIVTN